MTRAQEALARNVRGRINRKLEKKQRLRTIRVTVEELEACEAVILDNRQKRGLSCILDCDREGNLLFKAIGLHL